MTSALRDLVWDENDVASHLGKGASTIRRWAYEGKLPPFARVGRHKLFLRPVVDECLRAHQTHRVVIDLSPYPALLGAAQIGDLLRLKTESIYTFSASDPSRLPPRAGREWATQDVIMWLAQKAGVAEKIELVTQPIVVSQEALSKTASLVELTRQLQSTRPSQGRGR